MERFTPIRDETSLIALGCDQPREIGYRVVVYTKTPEGLAEASVRVEPTPVNPQAAPTVLGCYKSFTIYWDEHQEIRPILGGRGKDRHDTRNPVSSIRVISSEDCRVFRGISLVGRIGVVGLASTADREKNSRAIKDDQDPREPPILRKL